MVPGGATPTGIGAPFPKETHMMRVPAFLILSVSLASGALAQVPAPGVTGSPPPAGDYSGTVQEWAGAGSSDIKLNIRNITADGRVTGHVSASGGRKSCARSLPLSGIVLRDGAMRLEVNAGAPEGCERIYNVKAESGSVSGTYVDAVKSTRRPTKR
jgi:hypothetical protein